MNHTAFILGMGCLLACTSDDPQASESEEDDHDDSGEIGETPSPMLSLETPLSAVGLCSPGPATEEPAADPTGDTGPSPFGTGAVVASLGVPGSSIPTPAANVIDTGLDMEGWKYNLYIPPDYDGSEPYGLAVFINSGNSGEIRAEWQTIFDERKMIWVGPQDVGNAVDVSVRMGAALLGTIRAMELFNIDRNRVLATGNSGGARTAQVMTYQLPQLYLGAFPLCGAAYPRELNDDGYAYWGAGFYPNVDGQPFASWSAAQGQQFAMMTSFEDFREDEILNILHQGMRPDDVFGRVLEVPGGHCAATREQLREALAFVEHGVHSRIDEGMRLGADRDNGLIAVGAVTASGDALQVGLDAVVIARAPIVHQRGGGILAKVHLTPEKARAVWSLSANPGDRPVNDLRALDGWSEALQIMVDTTAEPPRAQVSLKGSAALPDALLFSGILGDDVLEEGVNLELHLWNNELQLIFDSIVSVEQITEPGRILNDGRTVRLRNANQPLWETDWGPVVMSLASLDGQTVIERLHLVDDVGLQCVSEE